VQKTQKCQHGKSVAVTQFFWGLALSSPTLSLPTLYSQPILYTHEPTSDWRAIVARQSLIWTGI
jgi:hypothetical protein